MNILSIYNLGVVAFKDSPSFSVLNGSPLQVLRLDGTSICDDGANALAFVIPRCAALEELWVQLTHITPNGARHLLAAARLAISDSGGLQSLVVDDDLERVQWRRFVPLQMYYL